MRELRHRRHEKIRIVFCEEGVGNPAMGSFVADVSTRIDFPKTEIYTRAPSTLKKTKIVRSTKKTTVGKTPSHRHAMILQEVG
jgi:hypothetical protein